MEKDGKYYTQVFLEKLNYSSFRVNKRNLVYQALEVSPEI